MADITFALTIGGTALPVTQFNMTGGAFGTVGHLTVKTTQTMLDQCKLDLFGMTSGAPAFVEVILTVTEQYGASPRGGIFGGYTQKQSATARIFGGEYTRTVYSLDDDVVEIHARDYAGVLVDQKRILTKIAKAVEQILQPLAPGRVSVAGISNENQTVANIVTSIANEFGFNPVLNLSSDSRNPTVGTLYGSSDQSFLQVPQSLWSILNSLARDTGYDCYVTPSKDLVFGEPGAGLTPLTLTFNVAPQDGQLPCRNAKIEHHPRRNSTFRVLVISYDPTKAQATIGRATYIAGNFAGQHGLAAGLSVGQAAVTADANILGIQKGTPASTPAAPISAANALPVIAQYESGNRNVLNEQGPGGTPLSTASGYYQIINGTWKQFAAQVPGASAYATAQAAPLEVQTAVATKLYDAQGFAPWSSNAKLMSAIGASGGANITAVQIPLYSFHIDGLSADQANMKAESIATDIAKRELIFSATIDGYPTLLPTQKLTLGGDVKPDFSGQTFYVSGYEQMFRLPGSGRQADSGWSTHFTALNIPTEGLATGGEG